MSTPLLEVRDLTLRIGGRTLARELSFCLNPGEIWCLLGPNGAGKTTLLNTVTGLREPQGGSVHMAGRALEDWPPGEAARVRGFLPQTMHDAFSASVAESVLLGRHPYLARWQWEGEGDRELVLLAQDPPLLLLDEPVSHLDLHHQILVLEHLGRLARERGKGVLFTVHDLNLAARFADHALMLTPQGTVRQGPIGEVMTEPDLWGAFGHRVARVQARGRTLFVPE